MTAAVWLLTLPGSAPDSHTHQARLAMAQRIARLRDAPFAGVCSIDTAPAHGYFVPEDCLDEQLASRVGIAVEADLFGGVVPHAFVAGKAIAHPLVRDAAARPPGWAASLGTTLAPLTLPGYTAYAHDDALLAAERLLADGDLRIKRVLGIGGRGQWRVATLQDARAVLAALDAEEVRNHGVVLERHLERIETFSIGEARIGDAHISYHGTQHLVRSRDGAEVYGGSTLHVRRGGLDTLLAHPMPATVRDAAAHAHAFDRAVARAYPGFYSSRRNYDVACGSDAQGRHHCGVLQQSWRIGGASPAEILAMEAFAADPARDAITVSTHECHAPVQPPAHAVVYWHDPQEPHGPLLKYATVDDADTDWNGRGRDDRDSQQALATRGFAALTYDQRGHGRDADEHDSVTREQSFAELAAVVDAFAGDARVRDDAVCLVGFSYGAYLAALLAPQRRLRCLVLRSPALYPDRDWTAPKEALARRDAVQAYRSRLHSPDDNAALEALARFDGDVLLIEAEHDDVLPPQVADSVWQSLAHARSRTRLVIRGADHARSDAAHRAQYRGQLCAWLTATVPA